MPVHIKVMVSIAVLAVGAIVFFWERSSGIPTAAWIVAGLAVFMVFAMWLFPEPGGKKK